MASKLRQQKWVLASDRALVEMSKTMNLDAIVRKTGWKPDSVLRTAIRLSITIKDRKAK
jgi:predicted RNA-binding protein with PUA-like domain